MPAKVTKVGPGKWRVSTPNMVHAKSTSLANAKAQARLLRAVDHGWRPNRKKKRTK